MADFIPFFVKYFNLKIHYISGGLLLSNAHHLLLNDHF